MTLFAASFSSASQTLQPPQHSCLDIEVLWEEMVSRHRFRLQARTRAALARYGLGTSSDLVDELVQEVFCRLLERHGRSLTSGPARNDLVLGAYLGRMAERVVVDRVRHLAAAKRGGRRLVSLSQPGAAHLAASTPDREPTPEERLIENEDWRRLWRGLAATELGEHGRSYLAALALIAISGWTSREVAGLMPGRPSAATLHVRLHRLRHRLRRVWREGG